ncbi:hypothetical protein ACFV19_02265 [Streptomyces griseoluteus]|uniref:hypothetical protein n=1 Tax=Streptomyces griseoluteus TaxID=29306 RepID=UPI0036835A56
MTERPTTGGTGPRNFEALLSDLDDLVMQEERATVLWTPSAKGYESRCNQPFGEKLYIPEPFDCLLDTSGFRAPRSSGGA